MQNTEKIYIGKGNQVKDLDLFNIVINLNAAKGLTFNAKNGDTLLRLTFAKTKNPDKFGNTYTAYVKPNVKKVEEPVVETVKPKVKKSKKIEPSFSNH